MTDWSTHAHMHTHARTRTQCIKPTIYLGAVSILLRRIMNSIRRLETSAFIRCDICRYNYNNDSRQAHDSKQAAHEHSTQSGTPATTRLQYSPVCCCRELIWRWCRGDRECGSITAVERRVGAADSDGCNRPSHRCFLVALSPTAVATAGIQARHSGLRNVSTFIAQCVPLLIQCRVKQTSGRRLPCDVVGVGLESTYVRPKLGDKQATQWRLSVAVLLGDDGGCGGRKGERAASRGVLRRINQRRCRSDGAATTTP